MKKNASVINIDGLNGVGSSTQVNVLSKKLKSDGYKVLVNRVGDTLESNIKAIKATSEFFHENPDGIVINDGCIATPIQLDLQNGMVYEDLYDKYREILFDYEVIHHTCGLVNILIITDNIEMCNERIIKRKKLMGDEVPLGIEDIERERGLLKGFKMFDNYLIKRNLKFQVLKIDGDESILDIHDEIIKIISKNKP